MSVVLQVRHEGGVCVIDVAGRLVLGDASNTLRSSLVEMLALGERSILLNLDDLTYLDSSGIGVLVSGFASVNNQGGHLKLLKLTNRVKDLLLLTKLYTVFEVYDDEPAALASFSATVAAVPQGD
jgi:anti-sigma B factor antagonist